MEMSNDKEVNGISKNNVRKASKHKSQGQEMDQKVKSDQKNELNRSIDEKKCKYCGRICKPKVSCIWTEMLEMQEEKIIGQTAVTPRKFMKHQLHHQIILC